MADVQQRVFQRIASLTGKRNVLAVPAEFIRLLDGDSWAAIFLSQLIYWSDRGKLKDGWIYKTQKEWEQEICITRKNFDRARKKLEELGLLETKKEKAPTPPHHHRLHYRINFENLEHWLVDGITHLHAEQRPLTTSGTSNNSCPGSALNPPNSCPGSALNPSPHTPLYTETTKTETTGPPYTPQEELSSFGVPPPQGEPLPENQIHSPPKPRQMTQEEFQSLPPSERKALIRQVAGRMNRIFCTEYQQVFGSSPLNHEPSHHNGLLLPKLQKAAEDFARNWLTRKIPRGEFRRRVRGALRRQFAGVSPPGDIAQMLVVWNRCVNPVNHSPQPDRDEPVSEELPREENKPRYTKGLVSLGEAIQQYWRPTYEISRG